MFCPKCGNETTSGAKFCPHCGAQFPAGPAPSAPETPVDSAPSEPETPSDPAPSEPETSVDSAPSAPDVPSDPAPFAPETPAAPAPYVPEASGYTMPAGENAFGASAALADGGKKRVGTGLIIGGAAVLVAVLVLAVAALGGLFSSPKDQLAKAFEKTFGAYAGIRENLGVPDMTEFLGENAYSRRISLALDTISPELTAYSPELSALKGLGFRIDTDYDLQARQTDVDMAVFWSDQDLLSFQILVDDGKIYLASPDFTGGDAYGFNTETLGADLVKLGAEDDEVDLSRISFNIFDLAERSAAGAEQRGETAKAGIEAYKQLWDAIEVEKGGKERIDVNGGEVNTFVYYVTVPAGALEDAIDAMAEAMKAVDSRAAMEALLEDMGFDRRTIQEMTAEMDDAGAYDSLADAFRQAVRNIGDLELEVYVSDGSVAAVQYADRVDGTDIEIGLYLGGGDNYVDDWSLKLTVDGETLTVESTGSHTGKDGVFTDKTTLRVDDSRITSVLRYEPKATDGNFSWELKMDNTVSLAMEGQLTVTKDTMDLRMDELSVRSAWSRLFSLKGSYYLGPCEGMQVSFASPKLLAEMSEGELLELYLDIMENADNWGYDLLDRIPPELAYALY